MNKTEYEKFREKYAKVFARQRQNTAQSSQLFSGLGGIERMGLLNITAGCGGVGYKPPQPEPPPLSFREQVGLFFGSVWRYLGAEEDIPR